ncbi:5-oxoprolinase subunit PxpB [uncultured Murdochiella sp.]|uniref:5-oxoprolinase subunit PxpB n=1 Tax=uncultured Murdochiella sp. TaxID=1586095 RepID=UPI00280451E3|nr:5-oxoprolinase subunit PxpB [uncultured Murdochiella sp.]
MYEQARFLPMGDCALVMEFANEISKEVNARIRQTTKAIEKIEGVIEVLPTYRSITIFYRPDQIAYDELVTKLQTIKEGNEEGDSLSRRIEIPTVYGGEYGPDLAYVAQHASLSEEEVIRIHTGTDYLVYMLGFSPGFTYLGGLDERIATPRLESPRVKIPAGSVGIAGSQTGMYPSESPGGWQLIGRTPLKLYDPAKEPPVFIQAGDYIRYVAITESEYAEIEEQVTTGRFQVKMERMEGGIQ